MPEQNCSGQEIPGMPPETPPPLACDLQLLQLVRQQKIKALQASAVRQ